MNTYFFTEFDKNHPDKVFISRFKNFIGVVQEYGDLPDLLRFLYGNSLKEVFDYCAKSKSRLVKLKHSNLNELKKDLIKFKNLFEGNHENVQKEVVGAYNGKKPVSSIEIYNPKHDIQPFRKCMEKFFFTKTVDLNEGWEIFVSNFKNILEVVVAHKMRLVSISRGEELKADLFGLFYGFSLQESSKWSENELFDMGLNISKMLLNLILLYPIPLCFGLMEKF